MHAADAKQRKVYFSLAEGETLRFFDRECGAIVFGDIECRLKAFLSALYGLRPLLRPVVRRSAIHTARRTTFDSTMIRMPESFSGFASHEAERLFKASIAHVGAHMLFSERFDLRSLKPVKNKVADPVYKIALPHHVFPGAEKSYSQADLNDKLKRGFGRRSIWQTRTGLRPSYRYWPGFLEASSIPISSTIVLGYARAVKCFSTVSRNGTTNR